MGEMSKYMVEPGAFSNYCMKVEQNRKLRKGHHGAQG